VNKVLSSVLSIVCFIACILILVSSILTSEKSLKFLLNLNEDFNVDIALNTSHWHPYRPSLEIDFLSIKKSGNPTDLLTVDTLKVNLNLLSFIEGSLVER